jgi:hypothetical protein
VGVPGTLARVGDLGEDASLSASSAARAGAAPALDLETCDTGGNMVNARTLAL